FPIQLSWFAEANAIGADPDGLYVVWFGGNDVIDGYDSGDPVAAETSIAAALVVFHQGLEDLLAMGARRVVVLNLPDLSLTPDVLERGDVETSALAHALCVQWNTGLAQIVADSGQPGVELFDMFAWFQEVVADPVGTGFTNVQAQAISTGGDDGGFLFWDAVHPTAVAHRKLAERMLAELSALAAQQPIAVTAIRHDSATMTVSIVFQSRPGGRYVIESSTALADGWEVLEGGFASQGEATTFSSRADSDRGFYRIYRAASPAGSQ
ncbi:MAG: outer membrane lipase/esterase, partial [Pseudoalteromonas tetraodonis]